MTATLHYLYDPLCGWCYGAAPALRALAEAPGIPPLALHPTGLFAGAGARPMDRSFAAYAWSNDQRIARLTGQVFSEAYRRGPLEALGRRFDSGPATRALTAVHRLAPAREVEVLDAIQRARFVEGQDITDAAVLSEILTGLGLGDAVGLMDDPVLDAVLADRLAQARALMAAVGAGGVPTLVLRDADGARALPSDGLYRDTAGLIASLR
jgi:putative protein-disulfide isomerase